MSSLAIETSWKAVVSELDAEANVWHADVTAESETKALRKALDVFLNTEEEHGVSFDYVTLSVQRTAEIKAGM